MNLHVRLLAVACLSLTGGAGAQEAKRAAQAAKRPQAAGRIETGSFPD